MASFPTYSLRCGPVKRRKHPQTVTGSVNAPFGYRIHERSDCRILPLPKTYEHLEKAKQREYEHIIKVLDFEKHTDYRIRKKSVWQRVQQGLTEYQDAVNERREKLRELLLREETNLIREVVDQAQHGDDSRMADMRLKSTELRKQQEEKRLALVAAKRMQQYLAQCPEIREKMWKKTLIETKMTNLAQMADNEAKKQAEKELDNLWHQLMLKEVESKKEREIEEVRNRYLIEQRNVSTLAKQVAGKLALEERKKQIQKEDREYLEQALEELRQEDLRNQEKERQRREELKRDLQEQVLFAKRRLAEQARHETEIDQLRQTLANEELAKERSKIKESSATLRNELLNYLKYLEDLRKEEAQRNIEIDRTVEEWTKAAGARRDLAVRRFKEAREKSLQEVLRGLDEQLRIKSEKEKEEMEQKRLEREALEKELELEEKLADRVKKESKEKMLRYRKDLEEQWKRTEEARLRERTQEIESMRLEELKRQQELEKLTEELLNASDTITPHPFKILLKQCAARYAAEKEGRCYCPPPLSEE